MKSARLRKALVILLLFLGMAISGFVLPQAQQIVPKSFAAAGINQLKCAHSSIANFQSTTVTFTGAITAGHLLAAVVAVQGSANTVINWVNITDSVNGAQFKQWVRTTDFANSLMVAVYSFNNTLGAGAGGMTVSAELKNTVNNNQNVELCAYDISGISGSAYTVTTNHQEGGGASFNTVTTGDITLSGDAGNSGGGALAFSGTADDVSGGNYGAGHGTGTWNGLTGVTFNEEADASFTSTVINPVQPIVCSMYQPGPKATLALSGGSPSPSTVLCDGISHNITVNPNATLIATEPASSSTNRNVFAGGVTFITRLVCASGTCSTWSFTNFFQDNDTYNWTPPIACNSCASQRPQVTVSYLSAQATFNLAASNGTTLTTSKVAQWIDNNTAWTTTNPFYYNAGQAWTPSPNGGTIIGSPTITITYTAASSIVVSNGGCFTDPIQAMLAGQWLCGAALTYGNVIGISWFFGIVAMLIPAMIYLKSGNAGLTVLIFVVVIGLFGVGANATLGNFLPSSLGLLGLGVTVVAIAGIVYKLYAGRGQ